MVHGHIIQLRNSCLDLTESETPKEKNEYLLEVQTATINLKKEVSCDQMKHNRKFYFSLYYRGIKYIVQTIFVLWYAVQ